ncbi:2-hydroxy-palmitic acid dioxygenase MPO1 PWA37_004071 [Arxiozyma heterogenica]|uniref:2-hydroxy-palmitic acid dioxygenase MPO1 n=1 Tax=Arxiozyma heterogenica TaxID=278026 RepID=UPI002F07F28E
MDLRSQLKFYKHYHCNATNVLIHSIFVPIILYTSLAILSDIKIYQLNVNIWVSLIYSCFYIYLCVPTGIFFVILFFFYE